MPLVKKWFVFYDTGEIVSSDGMAPEDVPVDGIQWIKECLGNSTSRNVHGMDMYRWTGDSWAGMMPKDLDRWLRLTHPEIKFGRWMSDTGYEEIGQKVKGCCDGC